MPINIKMIEMTLMDFLLTLLITIFITTVILAVYGNKRNKGLFWFFFITIFLAGMSAKLWIVPFGPILLGVAWLPILLVGILFGIVLWFVSIRSLNYKKVAFDSQVGAKTDEDKKSVAYGAIFWIMVIILTITVIIGYALE